MYFFIKSMFWNKFLKLWIITHLESVINQPVTPLFTTYVWYFYLTTKEKISFDTPFVCPCITHYHLPDQ